MDTYAHVHRMECITDSGEQRGGVCHAGGHMQNPLTAFSKWREEVTTHTTDRPTDRQQLFPPNVKR